MPMKHEDDKAEETPAAAAVDQAAPNKPATPPEADPAAEAATVEEVDAVETPELVLDAPIVPDALEVSQTINRPAPVALEPDELEKEFDEAIAAIDEDNELTPSQQRAEKLRLKVQKREYADRRVTQQQASEDAARNAAADDLGVTRKVFDKVWGEAVKDSTKTLGRFSHDAAQILLRQKVQAIKTAKPAAKPAAAANVTRDAGGKFSGAQIAPTAGRGKSVGSPKLTADQRFEKELERIGY